MVLVNDQNTIIEYKKWHCNFYVYFVQNALVNYILAFMRNLKKIASKIIHGFLPEPHLKKTKKHTTHNGNVMLKRPLRHSPPPVILCKMSDLSKCKQLGPTVKFCKIQTTNKRKNIKLRLVLKSMHDFALNKTCWHDVQTLGAYWQWITNIKRHFGLHVL